MIRLLLVEYQNFNPQFVKDFFDLVESSDSIVITGHEFPDPDSLAAVLSLFSLLKAKYPTKKIQPLSSGEPDDRLKIFENYSQIKFLPDISTALQDVNLLIMLDGCEYTRFSHHPEVLRSIPKTICIDHHGSKPDSFSLSLIMPAIPACTQIIYQTFFENQEINKPLAEVFLWGIFGDTGTLSYLKPNQTETLLISKKLLDIAKVEIQDFLSRFSSISQKVFLAVAELIKNTHFQTIKNWPPVQYSYLDRSFVEGLDLSDTDVSDATHVYSTNYIRMIKDYPWGFLIYPTQSGEICISCRSLPGSVNVRLLMEQMEIGGGHDRASGGTFKTNPTESVSDCIENTLTWIGSHNPTN